MLGRLSDDSDCVLEREPLERMAGEGELHMYRHDGFWQCADTVRDVDVLRTFWQQGRAPWCTWSDDGEDRTAPGAAVVPLRRAVGS